MCLLLGATGVGKTLLVKRLQTILPRQAGGIGAGGLRGYGGAGGERGRGLPGLEASGPRSTWGGGRPGQGRASAPSSARLGVLDRLAQLSSRDGKGDLGDPPPTRPTVGTNLTDIVAQSKITIRELGGCMGPIWPSYYGNCRSLLFMMDASNPTQLSASCVQLLGLLSAEELAEASVLILFNKMCMSMSREGDLPCYMTTEEMKSLIRLPDLVACAKQSITTVEISARNGTGLSEVLRWLQDTHRANG
ncbi:ADP-ribosylation factor-like protein 16 [Camelus dromedarius]|uniref:ADP-ribosylation factor-like protein 16 n=1 Tax=Camelus dromedarius TaxID=9838 RepID=A0A5N4D5U7_CAMDR|nr:ADP-ribosylation factor-like protein 16 [Camelus dromedarius]